MTGTFATHSGRVAFLRACQLLGNPTIRLIPPVTNWTLPNSYSYSYLSDTITTGGTQIVPAAIESSWWFGASTEVLAFPVSERGKVFEVSIGGVAQNGTVSYLVQADHRSILSAAWGVQIGDGSIWNVSEITDAVPGSILRVKLEKK